MTSIGGFPRARIVDWLATEDRAVVEALFRDADRVRREEMGDGGHLRGLIEISNVCGKECLYCGLRRSNAGVERYKMSADDIVEAAREAHGLGYRSVVIQSGESGGYTVGEMADVVARLGGGDATGPVDLGWVEAGELAPALEAAVAGLVAGAVSSPVEARGGLHICLLYTSPSPRDRTRSRMPSSA